MSKRNRQNRKKQTIANLKAQRGFDRQHFIETNGDMKQWRPPHTIIQNKKRVRNKRACRGKWHG